MNMSSPNISSTVEKNSTMNRLQEEVRKLQAAKSEIKVKISEQFDEFRKKIKSSIDKSEKIYLNKINQICISNTDTLTNLMTYQLNSFEVEKYVYQTTKLIQKIRQLHIEKLLKNYFESVKGCIDLVKAQKIIQDLPKITYNNSQFLKLDNTIKIQSSPAEKILALNNKLFIVAKSNVSSEKYMIDKSFDFIVPITIYSKNSFKHLFFTLMNKTIGLYTTKLILHSFRAFQYQKEQIVSIVQLKNYIFVVEGFRIKKINLNNLNEVQQWPFHEQIYIMGNSLYQGMVQIGTIRNMIIFAQFETLSPIISLNMEVNLRIKHLRCVKDYFVVILSTGFRVFKNYQVLANFNAIKIIDVFKFFQQIMVVTTDCHIYTFHFNRPQSLKRVNEGFTKSIKDVACTEFEVSCLSSAGNRVFIHNL